MRVTSIGSVFCAPKTQGIQKTQSNNLQFISTVSKADQVSFSGNYQVKPVNVDIDTAEFVANSLSTSTSGHRAPYGSEKFSKDVVQLLTLGVAKYAKDVAKEQDKKPVVLIGGDTRQASKECLPMVKDTLLGQGVDVLYIDKPVPTPLHALATKDNDIDVAILMTASHNPWADGGYNLVTKAGAIAPPEVTKEVAKNMVQIAKEGTFVENKASKAKATKMFPYEEYKNTLNSYGIIDWDNIKKSNISIHYDPLRGTGENALPKLLADYNIPMEKVHSGEKEGPNPTGANLTEMKADILRDKANLKIGIANDGDADRFGVVDENGKFIEPNDVILLTAHHLANNKGKKGDIIRSQATSSQLDIFAKNNGVDVIETPVGFKYIGEDIIDLRKKGGDILVAGEESGGLTVNKHIPEKDGVLAVLTMLDLVATEGKPISQILSDVKKDLGVSFQADSFSKKLEKEEDKAVIMNRMNDIYNDALDGKTSFGDYEIDVDRTKAHQDSMESYKKGGDGVKLYFTNGDSVLVRKSGTEPKVKAYIECIGDTDEQTSKDKSALRKELDEVFTI
ncbi:MAG: hypothetical protein PHV37_05705 [Candidatus Gastranaerophilales bacterium]|nr:hypothetical protein [Candidatus Gastranaerophilales bacterium]